MNNKAILYGYLQRWKNWSEMLEYRNIVKIPRKSNKVYKQKMSVISVMISIKRLLTILIKIIEILILIFPFLWFTVADHLQSLWTPSGGSSTFTTPSPPDHGMGTPGSPNLHSLFSSSPLLAASIPGVAAAAAAAHLQSLPPPPPPGPSSQGGQRLSSPGSTEQDIYGGQAGSYPPFGSFHQVKNKQKK